MFDAHTHMHDPRFDAVREQVMRRAVADQITGLCCCGTAPSDWAAVRNVCERYNSLNLVISAGYGVHPWYVENLPDDWICTLEEALENNPVAVIGEIGLDGIRKSVPRERQAALLRRQLELAAAHHRPVILHGARAWGELVAVMQGYADKIPAVIAHGFSGSAEIMRTLIDMGFYLSFAGSVCNVKAAKVRAAAALVPLGQLLVETDSPDIFPAGGTPAAVDERNRPVNQPSNLKFVCNTVAELRQVSADVIADVTASNARTALFGT